jgi:hypothetical protein
MIYMMDDQGRLWADYTEYRRSLSLFAGLTKEQFLSLPTLDVEDGKLDETQAKLMHIYEKPTEKYRTVTLHTGRAGMDMITNAIKKAANGTTTK